VALEADDTRLEAAARSRVPGHRAGVGPVAHLVSVDPHSRAAAGGGERRHARRGGVEEVDRGEPPVVFGDGEQSRDFIYVENVAAANVLAAGAGDIPGGILNIAGGRGTTVNELAARINTILKARLAPVYAPERTGDIKHSYADISAARARLGFEPVVFFEEGLERTIRWYKERS